MNLADKIHVRMNYYKLYEIKDKIETSLQKFYTEGSCIDLAMQHDEKYFTGLISVIKQNLPPNSMVLDRSRPKPISTRIKIKTLRKITICEGRCVEFTI